MPNLARRASPNRRIPRNGYRVLAVTACPNGIAHTYMAAETLAKTRQAAGGASDSFGHSLYKHMMNGVSHMLPFVVGGGIMIALAGSLSMVFGCALRAPHGGIFVFPVVDHALLYVVALIVGSVVGAVILSLLKKEYVEE